MPLFFQRAKQYSGVDPTGFCILKQWLGICAAFSDVYDIQSSRYHKCGSEKLILLKKRVFFLEELYLILALAGDVINAMKNQGVI